MIACPIFYNPPNRRERIDPMPPGVPFSFGRISNAFRK